jgi:hypothetical protein
VEDDIAVVKGQGYLAQALSCQLELISDDDAIGVLVRPGLLVSDLFFRLCAIGGVNHSKRPSANQNSVP